MEEARPQDRRTGTFEPGSDRKGRAESEANGVPPVSDGSKGGGAGTGTPVQTPGGRRREVARYIPIIEQAAVIFHCEQSTRKGISANLGV